MAASRRPQFCDSKSDQAHPNDPHTPRADGIQIIVIYCLCHFSHCWLQPLSDGLDGLDNRGSSEWYGWAGLLLIGMTALQKHSFRKAENTYENGGGGGCVLGLFSRVINKVCGKQRGTESLWFTGNGWRLPQGGITTASCLKKYHKDQANPPITPTWSSSEEFMENGKGWSPINTDAIGCSSQPAPCYTMLLLYSAIPQFNQPPPTNLTSTPTHPNPPPTSFSFQDMTLMLACWFTNSENVWSTLAP